MSLYNDASLVMVPSGVKDGKLYNLKPKEILGDEIVVNGTFDTDSDWIKGIGITIANGVARFTDCVPYNALAQYGVFEVGKTYKITFNIRDFSGGNFIVQETPNVNPPIYTAFGIGAGDHNIDVIYTATTTAGITFKVTGGVVNMVLDDVSVKEVTQSAQDFTFSRGSNLAATRVDVNGLIEKGRENLITYSNSFDQNTWSLHSAQLTSGQQGYDGSNNAWKLYGISIGATTARVQKTITTSGVTNFSVYAKAAEWNYFGIYVFGTNKGVVWSLIDGSVQNPIISYPEIYANGESVGNGWWRFSFSTNGTNTDIRYWACENNTYNGNSNDGSSGIYIQDSQAEVGLVATDYIESGSTTGKAGVLENLPRLDYSGGASCPTLLLEPERTNYVPYSEKLNSNGISGGTYYANQVISPDGTRNAYGIDLDSNGNRIQPSIGSYDGLVTLSMYIKPVANIRPRLNIYNAVDQSAYGAYFNWNGSEFNITPDGSGYTNAGYENAGNGWYRLWVVGTSISGGSILGQFRPNTSSDISERIYVWGLQAERNTYPTSYIPTHGAQVTRTIENAGSVEIDDIITSSNFTFFLNLGDWVGSDANTYTIYLKRTAGTRIEMRVRSDGYRVYYNAPNGGSAYPISGDKFANKFCVAYDGKEYRLFKDGVKENTYPSINDTGWNELFLTWVYATHLVKGIALFNTSLTDSECIALTQ